ncbi:hypothetical protein M5K25_019750 [Dendrobium thyrsiflorum]|uniref:Uncharacterized protein n=1 Tax=Dendrobium thyrsiflorum TaxID=117978 RepID=A0ABD0UG70_DENTH
MFCVLPLLEPTFFGWILLVYAVAGCWSVLDFDWIGGKDLRLDDDEAGFLHATLDVLICICNLGGYLIVFFASNGWSKLDN